MSGNYWIKLYIEIIDDPKMATLPDRLWRRVIELFLLAGKMGEGGLLPTTSQLAWLMRMETDDLELDMQQLANTEIIEPVPNGWLIPKFKERQAPIPTSLRVREHREKIKQQQYYQDDVTNRYENVTQINRLTESESESEQNHNRGDDGNISRIRILYENSFGFPPAIMDKELALIEKTYPGDWIEQAFDASNKAGARGFSYVRKVLENRKNGKGKDGKIDRRDTPDALRRYGDWEK